MLPSRRNRLCFSGVRWQSVTCSFSFSSLGKRKWSGAAEMKREKCFKLSPLLFSLIRWISFKKVIVVSFTAKIYHDLLKIGKKLIRNIFLKYRKIKFRNLMKSLKFYIYYILYDTFYIQYLLISVLPTTQKSRIK